ARLPINNIYGDRLNYYRGTFFRKQNRFNQALNYYNSIKYNPKFPITYIRSQFDATQMLIRNGNINTLDAITNLINLTFLWRGDDLEYDIWMKIVELYYNSQDYLKVLRIYKYILDAFPDNSSRVYISQQMADVYNKQIFSDNGIYNHLTDFQVVSIYYEFRELTPIGEEGDKITLSVASRLIKLDLLDQAEKILDHQIKYRLEGRYKILTADHLAAIYIMNHSPQKALDLLDETDEANYVYNEHLERLRIKAKALLDLAKYQEVLESLKLDDSREAKSIKEEACFQMAKWDDFIMLAESSILPYLAQSTNISSVQEKEILRLGIAYSMMGKQQDLQILLGKISDANPLLLDSLKLLLSSGSSINIYELDSRFKINEVDNYFKSVVRRMFNIN
ncbi:MAG: hypothetical protein EB127_14670, partial [Alphaproteobacteria bacterium]|nr:hypothetical protein [Alphaproteobacteria bacterium]